MITSWRFEFYNSPTFWGVLVVVVILVRLLGTSARAKGLALIVLSSVLILAIPGFTIGGLAAVWGFAGITLGVARRLCRAGGDTPRQRRLIATLGVLAVLGFLGFFKYQFVQDALVGRHGAPAIPSGHLSLLGVSYFSFKAIHTIVEAYRRSIPSVDGLVYFNYITFFPAFLSGPISRYPQFAEQMGPLERGTLPRDLALGGERIVHGLFKKVVLVTLIFPYILGQGKPPGEMGAAEIAIGLYAYAFYFYFDFAGYTDMAIGAARLMGMELPENFNRPFRQRNIRDLWSSWHMSLTNWLVDYIYWPLVRKLRNIGFFQVRPVFLSIVGMSVTFIVCGAWHGEAPHFLLWGLYHGMGISLLMIYQRQKRSIRVPSLQRYFRSRTSHVVGMVGTFHFFALGLALFVLDLGHLHDLLGALLR